MPFVIAYVMLYRIYLEAKIQYIGGSWWITKVGQSFFLITLLRKIVFASSLYSNLKKALIWQFFHRVVCFWNTPNSALCQRQSFKFWLSAQPRTKMIHPITIPILALRNNKKNRGPWGTQFCYHFLAVKNFT